MQDRATTTIFSDGPDRTCAIAARLGAMLSPGDTVLLTGDIGAGKTHFARCLIQSLLLLPEDVPSPTFTLVQTYEARPGAIWHADLYRLTDPNDVSELGLTEAFEGAICLVEWPDRLGDLAPENALSLEITNGPIADARVLTFRGQGETWAQKLAEIEHV
ncbi:tRNA threonylcarbamoyladenosine biosynthesis protein TsaE [Roseovarius nanhaiticus]|uniref:tRNA threonylcarbamoyladenosine biosynthesis protein TsaE n=1 Tax=Roseovarius nanhaiticus TaxID=573024 RepID=A0A1N7EI66_9RHOB|nr:tRNA (adenosine(37)-N6)-threonylcarbamoyltransferase complex ATPase subunit type 1 TsaE [Roseovarius nanhaiticus]SEK74229.1 tRNA threonylcarbamoyladenosine biosynthesis protein TsaE [Roseovarius nanhaiticus]SIR87699.1 tRNA threonylcarbamoyladenosine biosynthesis protein TsaE [Roseovarius nanhaiticus]